MRPVKRALPALVAHCDWSKDARKRWFAAAVREGNLWRLSTPDLVGDTADFLHRLGDKRKESGSVLVGFDFPIGLPSVYAAKTGFRDFPRALQAFGSGEWSSWYCVAARRSQISIHRPFYPYRPGGTRQAQLVSALDVKAIDDLRRRCELRTQGRRAACPLFWTLGAQQVGRAAIAGWRDVVAPASTNGAKIWPFDGDLPELLAGDGVVVAETYPAEAYVHLGLRFGSGQSKRRQEDRARMSPQLNDWVRKRGSISIEPELENCLAGGFGSDAAGEDRVDAVVGLFDMIAVVTGDRRHDTPQDPVIGRWEGWILGQAPE